MNKCLSVALWLTLLTCHAPALADGDIAGRWEGRMTMGPLALRIVFHFAKAGNGWTGTLDSPDQGAKGLPLEGVKFAGGKVHAELRVAGATYDGTLNGAGDTLEGTFAQRGVPAPLTLHKTADNVVETRPQDPVAPFPYDQEEVTYPNVAAGNQLAGTLTKPRTAGPWPAVLLIAGSGPNNRDEALMGHRPFLVLADYLTRRGFAVLRFDKRGIGKSTGVYTAATTADFTDDSLSGVQYLKGRKDIDPRAIALIGHSEGGIIAPQVAVRVPELAGVVLLAGTGVPGSEVLAMQNVLIGRTMGQTAADAAVQAKMITDISTAIKKTTNASSLDEEIKRLVKSMIASMSPAEQKKAGDPDKAADAAVRTFTWPWMKTFLAWDPAPTLGRVRCPVLALNGSKDLQVAPRQNLPSIGLALLAGGNPDVTLRELPGLNHLFQTAPTGAPMEYGTIQETLAPVVLQTVADWLTAHLVHSH